jgi:hypothetical protein
MRKSLIGLALFDSFFFGLLVTSIIAFLIFFKNAIDKVQPTFYNGAVFFGIK